MSHTPPQFREPGSANLPYGIPLGVSLQQQFHRDGDVDDVDMNIDGSSTPVFFGVAASPNPVAYHSFVLQIKTSLMCSPMKFGDLTALTNGVRFAVRDPDLTVQGEFPYTGIKDNADFYLVAPDYVAYDMGTTGIPACTITMLVRTQPAADALGLLPGWSIGVTVNDDLTGLASFRGTAFGRNLKPEIVES